MKNKDMKKIKKKLNKLEKALRRYDWAPGENQVKFDLYDFDEVIGKYMDLFEQVAGYEPSAVRRDRLDPIRADHL
jgi:hypothetical protein